MERGRMTGAVSEALDRAIIRLDDGTSCHGDKTNRACASAHHQRDTNYIVDLRGGAIVVNQRGRGWEK